MPRRRATHGLAVGTMGRIEAVMERTGRSGGRSARLAAIGLAASVLVAGLGCEQGEDAGMRVDAGTAAAMDELAVEPTGAATEPLDAATLAALHEALEDERRATAFYAAVMDRFGERRPFVNVIEAERRHEAAIVRLLERRGHAVPATGDLAVPTVPETFRAACERSVDAEIENMEMYDRLLAAITDAEARQVMERLQWASRERHLPAFARAAEGRGGARAGGGRGRGTGGGEGRGRRDADRPVRGGAA